MGIGLHQFQASRYQPSNTCSLTSEGGEGVLRNSHRPWHIPNLLIAVECTVEAGDRLANLVPGQCRGLAAPQSKENRGRLGVQWLAFLSIQCALEMNAAEDEKNIRWVRKLWSAMQPFSSGAYVNYETDGEAEQVKAAYSPEKYERLVALKNKYDPTNLFRLNQNIKPTV